MSDNDNYRKLPVPSRGPFRQFPAPIPTDPGVILYPDMGQRRPPGADDFYLRETWRIVRKRKWLILAIVFLATAYALIDTYRTKPLYRASATIEIGRDNAAHLVRTNEVFLLDDDSLSTSMKTSEVVLRSDPLLEDVVEQLQLDRLDRFSD